MIDLHAHILPGVDDGAPDMATALAMCAAGAEDGIRHVAATAHLFHEGQLVPVAHIERQLALLRDGLQEQGIDLGVSAATETPILEDIAERIAEKQVLPLDGRGRYILLESPHAGLLGSALLNTVVLLRSCGITAVVAHPEVCELFHGNLKLARNIVQQGAVLQVTASILVDALENGRSGTISQLLEGGLVHVVASDAHDLVRRPLRLANAFRCCADVLGRPYADLLFVTNPCRILAGDPVLQPGLAPWHPRAGGGARRSVAHWWRACMRSCRPGRGEKVR
ncbi:MAG: hypothetical protein QGG69_07620 [Kiritimatiellia bacterium]|nr:hypothetical protein [Kiritimatiellia bacterium]